MAKKRRRKKSAETTDEELFRSNRDNSLSRMRGRRGIVPRKAWIGLVLIVVFLFFLPAIIVRTPLKQVAINRVLSDFNGKVTVESISCGWITPTELKNIRAVDEDGELLFSAQSVKLRKSLTSMINATDYGTIEVREPILNLKIRSDGSNVEDALAKMMARESDAPSPAMRLSLTDAKALVTDTTTGREYQFEQIASLIEAFQPDEAPLLIDVEGELADVESQQLGSFTAKIVIDAGKDSVQFDNGLIELHSIKFPIEVASAIISRFVEPVSIAGILDGDVTATWEQSGQSFNVQLEPVSISRLVVVAPRRIGSDQIRLKNAWLQGHLKMTPRTLEADQLVCQTEIGSFNANGTMNWEQFVAVAGAQIPANNFQAEGTVNLAPLIAMLPDTLPLQEGMQIESGTIQFNANSRLEGADRRLVLNVESAGLTAIRNGQRLNWDKPARIVGAIRQTDDNAIFVESLECTTNFLTLNGTATQEQGQFQIQGDLKSAMAEVNQFFDIGETRIEGIVEGMFAWRFDGSPSDKLTSRPMRAGGDFTIKQPLVNLPGKTSWSEDEIRVVVQADGQLMPVTTAQPRAIRLDSGKLELINARQSLTANLVEPVENPSASSTWKLDCKIGGNVQNWLDQISTFVPVQADATGTIDASALLTVDRQQLSIHKSNFEFTNLEFAGYGLNISEPQMVGDAILVYDLGTGSLQIQNTSIASSALSARGQDIVFDSTTGVESLAGLVAFRADVNRCMTMFGGPASPDAIQWFGSAHGNVDLKTTAESIGGNVSINIDDLVAAQFLRNQAGVQNVSAGAGSWSRLLEEKLVTLNSDLSMNRSFDQISFQNTQFKASAAEVIANGSITDLAGLMNTNIEGTWTPDWQKLNPLLKSILGDVASVQGVQGGDFRMVGPIFNPNADQQGQSWIHPQLQMAAAASWQSGQVLGMPIGGSSLDLQLGQGVAAVNTQPIPIGGGTVNLSPQIDLRGEQMMLHVPQGRIINNIQLTPEICRGWMKYMAPMLADAATAEGRFSIDTGDVVVPLGQLTSANVNGQAVLHGANVGPGPLSQKLIGVIAQVKALAKGQPLAAAAPSTTTWINMPEQQIPFALHEGRVHHRGMQFQIDDVVIQTSGSVGLDQSMELVAQIPIMDSWVGSSRWTQGLKGQTLQIPVSGTVSNPQVDTRALQQISQQLVKQAAGDAINREVQGQVKGLIEKGNQRLENEITNGLKGLFGGDR